MKVCGRMVDRYLRSAVDDMVEKNEKEILCPCRKCKEGVWLDPFKGGRLKVHLLRYGFMDGYTRWITEDDDDDIDGATNNPMAADEEMIDGSEDEEGAGNDGGEEAAHGNGGEDQTEHDGEDADMTDPSSLLNSIVRDPHVRDLLRKKTTSDRAGSREEAKLEQLEVDSKTPLYDGCAPEVTRLSFTLELLKMKAKNKWSDKSLDDHLKYLNKKVLPPGNLCPTSVDEAKKIVCPLDLPHIRYHACINDCIIYRNENAEKTSCPVCNADRYKKAGKKSPQKVVWYFPIIPRLQRYFVDPKEAELMRWHAVRKVPDDGDDPKMRHPVDGSQWRALNAEYGFHLDPRNVMLGVSSDGMNPFGKQNTNHSTWPVFVWMYNIPPWKCMKTKYIHMSILIQGPKQPGNNINLYLELLKEELEMLWKSPFKTWDAFEKEYFYMKGAVLTTVHDYLGYGYVSGQVCHGYCGCTRCMDDTTSQQLTKDGGSAKIVYMGHRRWLEKNDPWRNRGDLFNGETEHRGPPRKRSGAEIDELLKNWKECPAPGKMKKPEPLLKVWKTRSVFWDLEYWPKLDTPHCLDQMHITKNVLESLLGTLMNMPEKTKDGPKARRDLEDLEIRADLHMPRKTAETETETEAGDSRRGKKVKKKEEKYCPPSCFTFNTKEIDQFFKCLTGIKVSSGYCGKISRYLDMQKKRFSGMKSHDCHVMMTQILPVALRGIMDKHVRDTLTGFCNFFDVISRKSISSKQLTRLQEEIVVILCELEMYFPPAFFDVMVHLCVHIVDDIIDLGPSYLHNMMPFERMNGVIKGFVRNMSRPDGSIVQGYLTQECISFCENYLSNGDDDVPVVGLPVNKHHGRLGGEGHTNGRRELHVDHSDRRNDFDRANLVVLQHLDVVDPFVTLHKETIAKKYHDQGLRKTDAEVTREHNSTFLPWFKEHVLANPPEEGSTDALLIYALAHGPAVNFLTYQAYDINGYTFYTEARDMKSDFQNSGVTIECMTDDNGSTERYYGRVEEIWELNYSGLHNATMFRVRWAKNVERENRYFTTMSIPDAKSATVNVIAKNEPWIHAKHVTQCFYITDPSNPSRVVVRRGKRNIVGMDGVANIEDYDQYGNPMREDDDDDEAYVKRRMKTTLPMKDRTPWKRKSHNEGLNYSETNKKGKKLITKKRPRR